MCFRHNICSSLIAILSYRLACMERTRFVEFDPANEDVDMVAGVFVLTLLKIHPINSLLNVERQSNAASERPGYRASQYVGGNG